MPWRPSTSTDLLCLSFPLPPPPPPLSSVQPSDRMGHASGRAAGSVADSSSHAHAPAPRFDTSRQVKAPSRSPRAEKSSRCLWGILCLSLLLFLPLLLLLAGEGEAHHRDCPFKKEECFAPSLSLCLSLSCSLSSPPHAVMKDAGRMQGNE